MAEGFAKYSVRSFTKKMDKFRSKRAGTVKIPHLVMERVPQNLLKFKIAEVKLIKFKFSVCKNIQQGL